MSDIILTPAPLVEIHYFISSSLYGSAFKIAKYQISQTDNNEYIDEYRFWYAFLLPDQVEGRRLLTKIVDNDGEFDAPDAIPAALAQLVIVKEKYYPATPDMRAQFKTALKGCSLNALAIVSRYFLLSNKVDKAQQCVDRLVKRSPPTHSFYYGLASAVYFSLAQGVLYNSSLAYHPAESSSPIHHTNAPHSLPLSPTYISQATPLFEKAISLATSTLDATNTSKQRDGIALYVRVHHHVLHRRFVDALKDLKRVQLSFPRLASHCDLKMSVLVHASISQWTKALQMAVSDAEVYFLRDDGSERDLDEVREAYNNDSDVNTRDETSPRGGVSSLWCSARMAFYDLVLIRPLSIYSIYSPSLSQKHHLPLATIVSRLITSASIELPRSACLAHLSEALFNTVSLTYSNTKDFLPVIKPLAKAMADIKGDSTHACEVGWAQMLLGQHDRAVKTFEKIKNHCDKLNNNESNAGIPIVCPPRVFLGCLLAIFMCGEFSEEHIEKFSFYFGELQKSTLLDSKPYWFPLLTAMHVYMHITLGIPYYVDGVSYTPAPTALSLPSATNIVEHCSWFPHDDNVVYLDNEPHSVPSSPSHSHTLFSQVAATPFSTLQQAQSLQAKTQASSDLENPVLLETVHAKNLVSLLHRAACQYYNIHAPVSQSQKPLYSLPLLVDSDLHTLHWLSSFSLSLLPHIPVSVVDGSVTGASSNTASRPGNLTSRGLSNMSMSNMNSNDGKSDGSGVSLANMLLMVYTSLTSVSALLPHALWHQHLALLLSKAYNVELTLSSAPARSSVCQVYEDREKHPHFLHHHFPIPSDKKATGDVLVDSLNLSAETYRPLFLPRPSSLPVPSIVETEKRSKSGADTYRVLDQVEDILKNRPTQPSSGMDDSLNISMGTSMYGMPVINEDEDFSDSDDSDDLNCSHISLNSSWITSSEDLKLLQDTAKNNVLERKQAARLEAARLERERESFGDNDPENLNVSVGEMDPNLLSPSKSNKSRSNRPPKTPKTPSRRQYNHQERDTEDLDHIQEDEEYRDQHETKSPKKSEKKDKRNKPSELDSPVTIRNDSPAITQDQAQTQAQLEEENARRQKAIDIDKSVLWRQATEFVKYALVGDSFMKYGRRGSPHLRHVTLRIVPDNRSAKINWTSGEMIFTKHNVEIVAGASTSVFKRFLAKDGKKDKHSVDPDLCLSVVMKERTLDLQANSKEERDRWIEGLNLLLHFLWD